jgi:outer membrane receptor for ferric coprogen and ferric-rhodotorulic acid
MTASPRLRFALAPLSLALSNALAQTAAPAAAASTPAGDGTTLPAIHVRAASDGDAPSERSGAYTVRRSSGATGLGLSQRETPQSVSVLTRTQMSDFALTSVNQVLRTATGVVTEEVETDRTYYTARGFDIVNFQIDGIGTPFAYGLVDGDLDTAVYDRIEVIRGANGLMSATGNPSATINFVRKRPTPKLQASAGLALGSWNDKRLEADVSGPLNAAGSLRGRLVAAVQDKDSYLDRYHLKKGVVYGVLEADLGERDVLTLGHTRQSNRPRGGMWGALPMWFSDGTPTNYDRSTNPAASWTRWNTDTGVSFAELAHEFDNGWSARAVLRHEKVKSNGKLFYVYGEPDPTTGIGAFGWPSRYDQENTQTIADLRASGPFELGGRKHELVVGASSSRSKLHARSLNAENLAVPLPDLASWDGSYPEPAFVVDGGGSDFTDKQRSVYAAARLNVADPLKLIVGANATSIDNQGTSYGASRAKKENKTTPYVGAVYDLTSNLSVYASRATIFYPQSEVGADLNRLPAASGRSVEAGVKAAWLDDKLIGSFAVFRTRQSNVASFVGYDSVNLVSIYEGIATFSRGFELELAGAITPRLQVNAGYTQLAIEDAEGNDTRTFSPRRVFRVSTTYRLPMVDKLKLGATLDWRSDTHRTDTTAAGAPVTTRQPAYALLDLMARYDFSERLSATLNLNNVTDKKYLTSLYWSQAFYGAPRHGSVSLNWTY